MSRLHFSFRLWSGVLGVLVLTAARAPADELSELKAQLSKQQELIETLSRRVSELEAANTNRENEYRSLSAEVSKQVPSPAESTKGFSLGKAILSAEGGIAVFHTDSEGKFPNAEFRVDEAKLFLEAPVWEDVYFFTELNLLTREESNIDLRVGELYVDFENVSRLWGQDRQLNIRVGRFDIPFGEEYLVRDAIDNPLISHSLSDIWGVDEGIEFYGSKGKWRYVLAVQNGGHPVLRDHDADKAIVAFLGYDPTRWLHLSASAMRTGDLDVKGDALSELWFGNGFIRNLGPAATTKSFHAELVEGDIAWKFPRGHLKAAGGTIWFDDDDTAADNSRDVYYYYVEGLYQFAKRFYGAARFSQIMASDGFPIVANGTFPQYFRGALTDDIWRLSLGLGYRWNQSLLLKTEYTFERGETTTGKSRNNEDSVGIELAFKF